MTPAPATLPRGHRIYAIADIHGCADRLVALQAAIGRHLAENPVRHALLLHLGDYIDKGEDSPAVVAHLAAGPPIPGLPTLHLAGNHEAVFLAALAGDRGAIADWLWGGGRATCAAYGLDPARPDTWEAAIPATHLAFLRTRLTLTHRAGGYLFVHAGIRPGIPLERQAATDLTGIRQPFLSSEAAHGAVIVHGHTARPAPEIRRNRIGLDTAAWSGGPLTCGVFEGDRVGFLTA